MSSEAAICPRQRREDCLTSGILWRRSFATILLSVFYSLFLIQMHFHFLVWFWKEIDFDFSVSVSVFTLLVPVTGKTEII